MQKRNKIIVIVAIVVLVALIAVLAAFLINRLAGKDKGGGNAGDISGPRTLVTSGVKLYVAGTSSPTETGDAPQLKAGDTLDYALLPMEYSLIQDAYVGDTKVETVAGERLALTPQVVAGSPDIFSLSPAAGTVLEAGTLTLTLQFTAPEGGGAFTSSVTLEVAGDASSVDSSADSSVAPPSSTPPKPPPEFVENTPSVTVDIKAKKATVLFKTDVESTVNAIVATSGEGVSTSTFYDYFNRNVKFDWAVSKKQSYSITGAGKAETYDLPDLTKAYYLLVNAVENETDTWQTGVKVILLYSPATTAPEVTKPPTSQAADTGKAAFSLETGVPSTVYALVTASDAAAPTAQQIRDGGTGYTGENFGALSAKTNQDKAPFAATVEIATGTLAAGNYTVWLVAQSILSADAPLTAPVQYAFSVA